MIGEDMFSIPMTGAGDMGGLPLQKAGNAYASDPAFPGFVTILDRADVGADASPLPVDRIIARTNRSFIPEERDPASSDDPPKICDADLKLITGIRAEQTPVSLPANLPGDAVVDPTVVTGHPQSSLLASSAKPDAPEPAEFRRSQRTGALSSRQTTPRIPLRRGRVLPYPWSPARCRTKVESARRMPGRRPPGIRTMLRADAKSSRLAFRRPYRSAHRLK
jgi:hypothetical protein